MTTPKDKPFELKKGRKGNGYKKYNHELEKVKDENFLNRPKKQFSLKPEHENIRIEKDELIELIEEEYADCMYPLTFLVFRANVKAYSDFEIVRIRKNPLTYAIIEKQ
jgi:hypothetical protein